MNVRDTRDLGGKYNNNDNNCSYKISYFIFTRGIFSTLAQRKFGALASGIGLRP